MLLGTLSYIPRIWSYVSPPIFPEFPPTVLAVLGYLFILLTAVLTSSIHKRFSKLLSEVKIESNSLVWGLFQYYGFERRHYQYSKLFLVFISLFGVLLISIRENVAPVVIGSIIGIFPLVILEANKATKKPYLVLEEVNVTIYPKSWHLFEDPRSDKQATNSVGVQALIRNEGRATAKNSSIKIRSNKISGKKYHTRWSEINPVERDIVSGEEQQVDLFWIDLFDEIVETAVPIEGDDESHYPPGDYDMVERPELSSGEHSFDILMSASNMLQRNSEITIQGRKDFNIPDDILDLSSEWEVIKSVKSNGDLFAIHYKKDKENLLEVSPWLDIDFLSETEKFSKENLDIRNGERYEEALRRVYDLKEEK